MEEADLEGLVRRAGEADGAAADELFALWYHELHRLAEAQLRRGGGGALTLGATTLVHEAYLDIAGRGADVAFADRARFLGYASRAMRGLVIDYARRRRAQKRGRHLEITLAGDDDPRQAPPAASSQSAEELVRLGDALEELAALEPSLAELVDLHFFGGFSFVEIAGVRQVSERTVQRDWRKARLLLHRTLLDDDDDEGVAAR